MLGKPDAFALSDTIGPHHWHESTRTRAVAWMNHWLQGGPAPAPMQTHRNLQFGFDYKNVDTGLAYEAKSLAHMRKTKWEASATPTGNTLDLPGERTVYDIMRDEADRAKTARPARCARRRRRTASPPPCSCRTTARRCPSSRWARASPCFSWATRRSARTSRRT